MPRKTQWEKKPGSVKKLIALWNDDSVQGLTAIMNVLNSEFDMTLTTSSIQSKAGNLGLKKISDQKKSGQVTSNIKASISLAPIPPSGFAFKPQLNERY